MLRLLFLFVCFNLIHSNLFCQTETDSLEIENNASFHHDRFHGQETSNGESYNKNDFTAAHRTLPFNTFLLVTNTLNDKSVVVRVNDRGPFKKSRVIDLTRSAAIKTIHFLLIKMFGIAMPIKFLSVKKVFLSGEQNTGNMHFIWLRRWPWKQNWIRSE